MSNVFVNVPVAHYRYDFQNNNGNFPWADRLDGRTLHLFNFWLWQGERQKGAKFAIALTMMDGRSFQNKKIQPTEAVNQQQQK